MTYADLDSLGWAGEDGKDAWFICMLKSKKRKRKKTYSQKNTKKHGCGAKGKEDIQNSVSGFTYALGLSYCVLSFPLPSEL